MFAIGNEELAGRPAIGETVPCRTCGERHPVRYGERVLPDGTREPCKLLGFYKCGDTSYVCAIDGIDITDRSAPPRARRMGYHVKAEARDK